MTGTLQGTSITSSLSWPNPPGDKTGQPPSKPQPPPTPKTVKNHVFLTAAEYAQSDVEATTPNINPDAIVKMIQGRQRIFDPQVLWYGNYRTIYDKSIKEEESTETIRHDFGSGEYVDEEVTTTKTITTFTPVDYNMCVVLGLCLGPNVVLKAIYANGDVIWEGETSYGRNELDVSSVFAPTPEAARFIFHSGQNAQNPDDILIDLLGTDNKVPGFVGTAYLIIPTIASKTYSGASFSFEVQRSDFSRHLTGKIDPTNADGDVNAAAMIWEIMRSDWSAMGLGLQFLDENSFIDFYDRCENRNYYFSYQDATDAYGASLIETIQALTGCVLYMDMDTELVKVKEYYWSAYDPDEAVLFDESNIIDMQEMSRPSWGSMPTHFQIKYTARHQNYKAVTLERLSRTANTDDKKSEKRPVSVNASIVCSREVLRAVLTRIYMHNGAPTQTVTFVANSDATDLVPGSSIKISYAKAGYEEVPFFVQSIKVTEPRLNQYQISGIYFLRPDADDFDDADGDSDFVEEAIAPITPTMYEFISEGIPPNYLLRLGVNKVYQVSKKFNGYALLLVRAESEGQIAVNVFNRKGAAIRNNVLYAASGFLAADMLASYKELDGYITSLVLTDGAALQIISGATIGYCGGEWFAFGSASFDGHDITLHNVERGLWGSQMVAHALGDTFWMMDDNTTRLFGPNKLGAEIHYKIVSAAFGGTGGIDDALEITTTFASNWDTMDAPRQIMLNGIRVLSGDVPTIYQDDINYMTWINTDRTTPDPIGVNSGEGQSYELIFGSNDAYFIDFIDSASAPHQFGVSGIPSTDFVDEFGFTSVTFTFNILEAVADGLGTFHITHLQTDTDARSRVVSIPAYVAIKPGLVKSFAFDWRLKFAAEFKFNWSVSIE